MDEIIKGVAAAIRENNADIDRKLSTLKREFKNDVTSALAQDFSNELIKEFQKDKVYSAGTIVRFRKGLWQTWTDTDISPLEKESGWVCVTNGVFEQKFEAIDLRTRKITFEMSNGEIIENQWVEPLPLHKGTWGTNTKYDFADEVTWNGCTWRCMSDDVLVEPGTTSDWQMTTQRGKTGKIGPQGDRGEKGDKGETGKDADPMVAAKIVMRELVKEVKERLNDE